MIRSFFTERDKYRYSKARIVVAVFSSHPGKNFSKKLADFLWAARLLIGARPRSFDPFVLSSVHSRRFDTTRRTRIKRRIYYERLFGGFRSSFSRPERNTEVGNKSGSPPRWS